MSLSSLLSNLFSAQALPDGPWLFFVQHFRHFALCTDHRPEVIFVPVSSLHSAFSGGFHFRADLKLRHSQLVGIEICRLCFQLLVLCNGSIQLVGVLLLLLLQLARLASIAEISFFTVESPVFSMIFPPTVGFGHIENRLSYRHLISTEKNGCSYLVWCQRSILSNETKKGTRRMMRSYPGLTGRKQRRLRLFLCGNQAARPSAIPNRARPPMMTAMQRYCPLLSFSFRKTRQNRMEKTQYVDERKDTKKGSRSRARIYSV